MRFTTRVLLLQLACVAAVVLVCTGVFLWLGTLQLREEAESTALGIARTVAAQPAVQQEVAAAADATPDAASLQTGPVQALATRVMDGTDALFVVVTDRRGNRLSHPDVARLGQHVSTSPDAALAGRETVTWERGTLGDSARAKVPVRAPGSGTPIGEVSVGFGGTSVFADLPALGLGIGVAAAAALALGVLASFGVRRLLERRTLGLQPEDLVALVQHRAAVVDAVGDGVLAVTPDGVVSACNAAAATLFDARDAVDAPLDALDLPQRLRDALTGVAPPGPIDALTVRDRIVYAEVREVRRGATDLGRVAVLRDRTDLVALAERLEAVGALSNALRAQRHEFANRLHVAAGLIDAGRNDEARAFLDELLERGPLRVAGRGVERITEPYLQAFVGAKSVEAAERGVELRVAEDTLLLGEVREPEDVATVLGNLVDNAVEASLRTAEPHWVEVSLLDDGSTLLVTVTDSGPGVPDPDALFAGRTSPAEADGVHGHGIGLPLSREIARRGGGDVWLADRGTADRGAMLCARLPGVVALVAEEPA